MRNDNKPAYTTAGVDLDLADRAKSRLQHAIDSTTTNLTLSAFGAFGGAVQIPSGFVEPALVASIAGVGTKLHLAIEWGRPETAGQDLVSHCLNDIAVQNARPIAFLDYVAASHMDPDVLASLVDGMASACRAANVSLVGGETAFMPDTYAPGRYDSVGVALGVAETSQIPDRSSVKPGDVCIGLPSSGPHTNGYSLARELTALLDRNTLIGDQTLEEALLAPHLSYVNELLTAFAMQGTRIAAHITGGGIAQNLARVLPPTATAIINTKALPTLPIFDAITNELRVTNDEMFRVFNMGVGAIFIVASETAHNLLAEFSGSVRIGEIVERRDVPVELAGLP